MRTIQLIIRYLRYVINSKTRYTIHSQFVYKFINEVLRNKSKLNDFSELWDYRKNIVSRNDIIETVDFGSGAGNSAYKTKYLKYGKLASLRSHSKKELELLYRIAHQYKPEVILELGTSAGISTAYLSKASPQSRIITMEGCANLVAEAKNSLQSYGVSNVEMYTGNFDNNLQGVLDKETKLDIVFFDGNHRKDPTLRYFNQCVELSTENTIFVFDDIHWSKGMEEAWEIIKKDERVSVTIDIFWFGICFFRKGIEKQDFIIRY